MVFNPTLLPGGYITDMLLTLSFESEGWEQAHIGEKRSVGYDVVQLGWNVTCCA